MEEASFAAEIAHELVGLEVAGVVLPYFVAVRVEHSELIYFNHYIVNIVVSIMRKVRHQRLGSYYCEK